MIKNFITGCFLLAFFSFGVFVLVGVGESFPLGSIIVYSLLSILYIGFFGVFIAAEIDEKLHPDKYKNKKDCAICVF
jgi:hypothetical protein